jgi:N,N'-diacetyllegionaminate synthase
LKKIKIDNHVIGEGEACFVIAEAGVNHNGDKKQAKKLIDAAKLAGADAVKFQTWKTDEIVTHNVSKPKYQRTFEDESQYDLLQKLELTDDAFRELAEYAKSVGVIFLSTPEGNACIDFIDSLGVPAFKIGSADLTNYPHLSYISQKRKPLILSTGMATLEEVKEAVDVIENAGNHDIILLHCTSNYPTCLGDVNLLAMLTLKTEFQMPIGYSDHTAGIGVSIMATLMGAKVIEKHFTLDKELPGPDHKASLEPHELKNMIKGIRFAEKNNIDISMLGEKMREISTEVTIEPEVLIGTKKILGHASKKPAQSEEEMIRLARKYIVAETEIEKGEVITLDKLSIKRSDGVLESKYLNKIIGKKAKKKIREDEKVTFDKVVG